MNKINMLVLLLSLFILSGCDKMVGEVSEFLYVMTFKEEQKLSNSPKLNRAMKEAGLVNVRCSIYLPHEVYIEDKSMPHGFRLVGGKWDQLYAACLATLSEGNEVFIEDLSFMGVRLSYVDNKLRAKVKNVTGPMGGAGSFDWAESQILLKVERLKKEADKVRSREKHDAEILNTWK